MSLILGVSILLREIQVRGGLFSLRNWVWYLQTSYHTDHYNVNDILKQRIRCQLSNPS
jgi:hypothetical protein